MNNSENKTKILVVEDDRSIAKSNNIILGKAGYITLETAFDGKSAIKIASEKKPDLILMDINLNSSMDGITAAREILKFSDIPIIFITAYSDEKIVEKVKK